MSPRPLLGRQAGQRIEPVLRAVPAHLAGESQLVQARDLTLSLDPRRVIWWKVPDQLPDALPEL